MQLNRVLAAVDGVQFRGDPETGVRDLTLDSRRVEPGSLFFCARGASSDGHDFAEAALTAGAAALVCDHELGALSRPVPQAIVADVRAAMAPAATAFFGDPTATLRVAGVTGTNGKTTSAFLIRHLLERAGIQSGLLGTVTAVIGGRERSVERTTPEAIDLQRGFRSMLDAGDAACAIEVSSHALELGRIQGTRFTVAAFTNLTQDHLDFHGSMERYFQAKRLLFTREPRPGAAVVNVDDPYGARLVAELEAGGADRPRLITFSVEGKEGATLRALDVSFDANGSRYTLESPAGRFVVEMPLPGHFNVANSLTALASAIECGADPAAAVAALAEAPLVPGRMEPIGEGQAFGVLVDYAHTPDSLDNVLRAARRLTDSRVIAVFGCGGDRDRDKRPQMGEISARLADLSIVTSDNPRSEDPAAILAEIVAGIPAAAQAGIEVEADRRAAIARGIGLAAAGDIVVIAGKGHESGQEFEGGRKIAFDDRQVAREELRRVVPAGAGGGA